MTSNAENRLLAWREEVRAKRLVLLKEARSLKQTECRIVGVLRALDSDYREQVLHAAVEASGTEITAAVEEVPPVAEQLKEDPILFEVPSKTQTGVIHKIRQRPGEAGVYCDCKAAQFGNHCWHLSEYLKSDAYRQYKYREYAAPSLGIFNPKPTETIYTSIPGGR